VFVSCVSKIDFCPAPVRTPEVSRLEVCRIRGTGVDSGKSWRFSAGVGAGPGVDIFDWSRSDF